MFLIFRYMADQEAARKGEPLPTFRLPWFSDKGFYFNHTFASLQLGLVLEDVDNHLAPLRLPGKVSRVVFFVFFALFIDLLTDQVTPLSR
jgi:hypothetical protein